jgi:hypothetical protein
VVRVDAIRVVEQEWHYQDRILFRGDEIPYLVKVATLDKHPVRWLRDHLLLQSKGHPYCAPGLRDLFAIALQFHEPEMDL